MIKRGDNRIARFIADVDIGHEFLDLLGPGHFAIDAKRLVSLGAEAKPVDGSIRVAQSQMTLLREDNVEVQRRRKVFVKAEAFVIEGDAFGGAVVGP